MNNIITATSELYLHDILEKKIIYLKQNSQLEDDHYIIETDRYFTNIILFKFLRVWNNMSGSR